MNRTTEIIFDNFFASLRAETFGEKVEMIPMSKWKWGRVEQLRKHTEEAEPFSSAAVYHFVSNIQEKRREKIFLDERHAIDTSIETLNLLNLIIYNIDHIERLGVSVPGILALGRYMRTLGNRIDFVKFDNWTSRLHIRSMTSLLGSILVQTMNFDRSELPFIYSDVASARAMVCKQLSDGLEHDAWGESRGYMRFSFLGLLGYWRQKTKNALDSIEE